MGDKPQADGDEVLSISALMERKLELAANIRELEAEIARINKQMQKMGAHPLDLICW
jgi:hypothetical protein